MATRNTKQTPADVSDATIINDAIPHAEETIHAASANTEAEAEAFFKSMFKSLEDFSWKRLVIAWVVGLATCAGLGYLGSALVAYLTIGAALLSGSALITQICYIVGLLITSYAAYRASVFAHIAVMDKSVDRVCSRAYGFVTGMFSKAPAPKAS